MAEDYVWSTSCYVSDDDLALVPADVRNDCRFGEVARVYQLGCGANKALQRRTDALVVGLVVEAPLAVAQPRRARACADGQGCRCNRGPHKSRGAFASKVQTRRGPELG